MATNRKIYAKAPLQEYELYTKNFVHTIVKG